MAVFAESLIRSTSTWIHASSLRLRWLQSPGALWCVRAAELAAPLTPPLSVPSPVYEKYCADHFADGRCDQGCNTEECGWDGLDCAGEVPALLARGVLVLTVLLPPEELLRSSADFLQRLSGILRTSLRFRLDENGQAMVFPYHRPGPGSESRNRRELAPEVIG